jgi:microcystin-dependent protein
MPFNGAGLFTPPGTDFPAVANTLIESAKFNNVVNDIAGGLSNVICKDGQTTPTANLPMGGLAHTNVGNATARNQYPAVGQIQDGSFLWAGAAGGSANAITLTVSPVIPNYVTGQHFRFQASATNTGATTVSISGLTTKNITLNGNSLVAGDIVSGGIYDILFDGTNEVLRAISIPAWTTGDVKLTYKNAADPGWLMFNDGTMGDASSGGTTRANADTQALYTLLWNNTTNTECPVSSGRGANATADFNAHKTITLPKHLGRALAVYGAGSGLTSRALAANLGEEAHVLSVAELAQHNHTDAGHGHAGSSGTVPAETNAAPGSNGVALNGNAAADNSLSVSVSVASATANIQNTGSNTAHNTMQPTTFLNVMVKL